MASATAIWPGTNTVTCGISTAGASTGFAGRSHIHAAVATTSTTAIAATTSHPRRFAGDASSRVRPSSPAGETGVARYG